VKKVDSPDAGQVAHPPRHCAPEGSKRQIELEVPIEGNLDDPQFHFGKVILHVLGNIMTKMITSPFAALGSVFGGKGEEISYPGFCARQH